MFGKLEELSRLIDSDVLTIVRKRKTNQIYIYSSTEIESLMKDLVRRFAHEWTWLKINRKWRTRRQNGGAAATQREVATGRLG